MHRSGGRLNFFQAFYQDFHESFFWDSCFPYVEQIRVVFFIVLIVTRKVWITLFVEHCVLFSLRI